MLTKVDLPAPFRPMSPRVSPSAIVSDTFRNACVCPKDLATPSNSTARGGLSGLAFIRTKPSSAGKIVATAQAKDLA
jgi:hypothetical protein